MFLITKHKFFTIIVIVYFFWNIIRSEDDEDEIGDTADELEDNIDVFLEELGIDESASSFSEEFEELQGNIKLLNKR